MWFLLYISFSYLNEFLVYSPYACIKKENSIWGFGFIVFLIIIVTAATYTVGIPIMVKFLYTYIFYFSTVFLKKEGWKFFHLKIKFVVYLNVLRFFFFFGVNR
jgi:hypothetical protein